MEPTTLGGKEATARGGLEDIHTLIFIRREKTGHGGLIIENKWEFIGDQKGKVSLFLVINTISEIYYPCY